MKPFEIGLTLTGSVSAGAYTAGVIDFLLDALEQWEQRKHVNRVRYGDDHSQWDVPWHDILLTGLSGASGGGVTCGLILNMIGRPVDAVRTLPGAATVNNDLYNIWVKGLGIEELATTSDLNNGKVKSLLNADALPDIANRTLITGNFGNTLKRPYITPNLRATVTVTNLRGIPYWLKTKGIGATQEIFSRYTDHVKFELARENVQQFKDTILIPYDTANPAFAQGYALLKAACLATCAFPGAFKVQPVTLNERYYGMRDYAAEIAIPEGQDYSFLCADGGILNTDPFELLHQDMVPAGEPKNPQTGATVERSIIIVAPLDTDSIYDGDYDITDDSLIGSLPKVIQAIRSDAMFSDEEIGLALDESVYSRFIIAPVRYAGPGNTPVSPAITGTALGNFAAFLSEDFRVHDFFRGRRNAQQFLRRNFAIPVTDIIQNPIFSPLDIMDNRDKFKDFMFIDEGIEYFCILPLCGLTATEAYDPPWPAGKYKADDVQNDIAQRTGKLIDVFLAGIKLPFLLKAAKFLFLKGLKNELVSQIMSVINKGLTKNKLG
jgi:patatin-like phospholipase